MHSLTHAVSISETLATEIIMNACKNNMERKTYSTPGNPASFTVTFNGLYKDENEAVVRDANGFVVAIASVDKFDK